MGSKGNEPTLTTPSYRAGWDAYGKTHNCPETPHSIAADEWWAGYTDHCKAMLTKAVQSGELTLPTTQEAANGKGV